MSTKAKFIEIEQKELKAISKDAQDRLREAGIDIPMEDAIPTIAVAFLKQAIKHVAVTKEELNLLQLFDMGIDEEDNTPYLVAGQELKLLIKSDDESEDE